MPIILCIIFGIKPSFKTFLYTFGICLICFFPFALYKYKTFQGIDFGESTFVPHNWKSISLIPFMGNTLDGIFSRNGFWRLQHFPKLISVIYFLSLVIPFCYLLFQVVSNLKKFGIERFKKETIFLLQFYIPALIYDITNPFEGPTPHNWYSFIFIISHANLTALFLSTIYSKFKNSNLQRTVIFSGISLLLFMTIDAFLQTKTFKTNAKGNLLSDNFQERYYPENKSLDSLLTFFMNKLNLTPKEYYERVYFEGGSPWSYKKLQLLGKKINYSGNLPNNQTKKPCFYIHSTRFLGSREVTRFFENFLKDTKIVRNKSFPLRSNDQRLFWVYEYYPIIKQSCYNNSFNTFVVDKEIRDLGHQSKGIDKNKEKDIKYLSFNETHNPNGTLDSLTGNYIIYDRTLRFPFGLGLSLYKKEGRYYLNCKIKSYYYHAAPYRLSNVNLFFIIDNHPKFKVNILTSNTLAAGYFTDNSKWYREVKLPINLELTKRNFQIKINWDVYIIKIDSENGNEILQISQSRRGYKNSFFLVH